MEKDILELEKILEQEINACSKLEQYITDKKDFLVKGDIEGIMNVDLKLEKYNSAVEKLEEKRQQLYPAKTSLNEIIDSIKEKNKTYRLKNMKNKLNNMLVNAQKQNNINSELIKYSLKIVESSISSIVNVLVPESSSYNSKGKIMKEETGETISSIIHEV